MSKEELDYTKTSQASHNAGNVLRSLMRYKGVDDATLARETGVPVSSLSRIKNDPMCNPTLTSLKPLANYFSVTVSQLIGETALNKTYIAEPVRRQVLTVKQVPLIGWSQISAYLNKELQEFKQWFVNNRDLSHGAFALQVSVNTWGPVFCQHAYLLIDPSVEPDNGDSVLVYQQQDDQYLAKKILKEGSSVYFQSLNPDLRQVESIKPEESIVGCVVEIRQELKVL